MFHKDVRLHKRCTVIRIISNIIISDMPEASGGSLSVRGLVSRCRVGSDLQHPKYPKQTYAEIKRQKCDPKNIFGLQLTIFVEMRNTAQFP